MANLIRENIDRWFDNNLDVDNRTIYMGSISADWDGNESGVDNLMAEYFIKAMHVLQAKSSDKEILIIMNNPGGDWYHGMAIYDAIKTSTCPCTIKVYGYAMSMGSIILQAGDVRILMPNSRFMIHFGYDGTSNHSKIVEKWADEGKRINHEMENIYLGVILEKEEKEGHGHIARVLTKIMNRQKELEYPTPAKTVSYAFSKKLETKKEEIREVLKQLLNFDTILTPEETVALGFADEVFGDSPTTKK